MMKRAAITALSYVAALIVACVLAAATSFPFLKPVDFSVQIQMVIMAVMSGVYTLAFTPLVIGAEVLVRKLRTHRALPLSALPVFGASFPVLGFVCFPDRWWPEEPFDMKSLHLIVFFLLALFSIGIGLVLAIIRNRRVANNELESIVA